MPQTQMAFATWPRCRYPVGAGANRVHASGSGDPAASVDVAASTALRSIAGPIHRLEGSRGGHQAAIEGEEVGLRHRAGVGHRHPEQDLAFALGIADRAPAPGRLGPTRLAGQLGALVEQPDDAPIERVDPVAEPPQLGRLGVSGSWASGSGDRSAQSSPPPNRRAIDSSARW